MHLIDTHTHLYLEHFNHDRLEVIQKAITNNIRYMLLPNIDLGSIKPMHDLCMAFPDNIKAMLGLHPTSVKEDFKTVLAEMENYFNLHNYIAIGETGIDLHWDTKYINEQKEALRQHFLWAEKYNLPLVIHSRKALPEVLDIFDEFKYSNIKGVFHCFPGDLKTAELILKMGFLIGVGGTVTYKKSNLAEVIKAIGIEHVVLETDSPYLPPVPFRGQRNESSFIKEVALKVADILELNFEEVVKKTSENAIRLFGLEKDVS